jgi:hypothetical protein
MIFPPSKGATSWEGGTVARVLVAICAECRVPENPLLSYIGASTALLSAQEYGQNANTLRPRTHCRFQEIAEALGRGRTLPRYRQRAKGTLKPAGKQTPVVFKSLEGGKIMPSTLENALSTKGISQFTRHYPGLRIMTNMPSSACSPRLCSPFTRIGHRCPDHSVAAWSSESRHHSPISSDRHQ